MDKTIRFISFFMIIFISLFIVCGCRETSEAPADALSNDLRISFINPWRNSPYWQEIERGMQRAVLDLGRVDLKILGPASLNLDKTIRDFDSAIAAKSDGIISAGTSDDNLQQAVDRATENGIAVVLVDSDIPFSSRVSFVGTDHTEAGRLAGREMVDLTSGKAIIGIITISKSYPHLNQRIQGFTEEISHSIGMKIVATEEASDILTAEQMAGKLLDEYPSITAIYVTGGEQSKGAAQVLQERNLSGSVKLIGFDLDNEIVQLIDSGTISATIAQKPFAIGYEGMVQIVQFIQQGKVDSDIINTSAVVITKGNLETAQQSGILID